METKYYDISGFNIPFICKVITFHNYYTNRNKATISFGGPGTYCMTISINDAKPGIAYIANVDYNEKCTKSHQLELHKGTYRLVKTALWATRLLYPDIHKFTFTDDSHIYCVKGSKEYKADLASDYIFKYNETWYEKNFGARLPKPIYSEYKDSIPVLDAPLQPISQPYLIPFADIYAASSTPRDFINNMRNTYKSAYCITVGPWLHNYLMSLDVDIPGHNKADWFINTENVHEVPGFTMKQVPAYQEGGRSIGRRRTTRKHRTLVTYQHKGRIVIGCGADALDMC